MFRGTIEEFYEANEVTTRNLLQACIECPRMKNNFRRFVHVSTVDIYSKALMPIACKPDPSTPLDVDSSFGYTVTKARADMLVQEAQGYGVPTTILRPAAVYGAGSLSFGATEAKEIFRGRMCCVNGGQYISGIVHVHDVAVALLLASISDNSVGRIYNLSDPRTGTWMDFYRAIALSLGKDASSIRSFPWTMTYILAVINETVFRLAQITHTRPLITRFVLALVGRDQLWPIESAQEDFGWVPRVKFEVFCCICVFWLLARHF